MRALLTILASIIIGYSLINLGITLYYGNYINSVIQGIILAIATFVTCLGVRE